MSLELRGGHVWQTETTSMCGRFVCNVISGDVFSDGSCHRQMTTKSFILHYHEGPGMSFRLHYHQCPRVSPPLSPVPSCFSSTITCALVFLFSFPPPRPFLCIQCMCTTIVRVYIRTRARTYTRQGADNEPEQSDLRRPGNGRSLGAAPEWPWAACHFAL